MKAFRIFLAAIVFAAFAILAHTQTRPAANPAAPASRPGAAPSNVAVIDSSVFSDDKEGIARVMVAMKALDTKYRPVQTELSGMRDRLNAMRADIDKKRSIQDQQMTAQQIDEANRLEVTMKRKAEDAQTSYKKEMVSSLEPLQRDIAQALTAYSQAKGISLLIDVNRVPVVYFSTNVDVTKDFIADYNRTHPVTGGARP